MMNDQMLPHTSECSACLTDLYQIRMSYSYWKTGKFNDPSVFEVFFRTAPFKGQYAVFAGVDELMRNITTFKFSDEEIDFIRDTVGIQDEPFLTFLKTVNASQCVIEGQLEGSVVFPHEPLLVVSGPLGVAQLLETLILNLLSYPTLVATKASRLRTHTGPNVKMIEFGLRRAQGPNGALSASLYSYIGGCDGTSNVKAGMLFGIPISGTTSHSYVTSFSNGDLNKYINMELRAVNRDGELIYSIRDIGMKVIECRTEILRICGGIGTPNDTELASFIQYAIDYPKNLFCLIDTYDTLHSGLYNCLALYTAVLKYGCVGTKKECLSNEVSFGLRIDSGDIAYLSKVIKDALGKISEEMKVPGLRKCQIVATNNIDEDVLSSIISANHAVDAFGIGTSLVTCAGQPALGLVYKLCELKGEPKMKISSIDKTTLPFKKSVYRVYNEHDVALMDYMVREGEEVPVKGQRFFARHPRDVSKRCYVVPHSVEKLMHVFWDGSSRMVYGDYTEYLRECKHRAQHGLKDRMRPDMTRFNNPTPYKVAVSNEFYTDLYQLQMELQMIKTIT